MRHSTYNPPNERLGRSVRESSNAARLRLIGLGDNAVWRIAMKTARGLKVAMAALALASVTLAGCVVAPAPRYYGDATVMVAPPPPQVEIVGVAPAPGYRSEERRVGK